MTEAAATPSPQNPVTLDALALPQDRILKLRAVIEEVLTANKQFNLTAIRDPDDAWAKHILDSLQGLKTGLFEGSRRVIDIGAGAGFPGLALAAARPLLRVTALDSTRKKCDFIEAAAGKVDLAVDSICGRAEEAGHKREWRETFDVAVARAVGSFNEVCELTLPFVKPGGHLVLWRGQHASGEVAAARAALMKLGADADSISILPYYLPGHEMVYHLVTIAKVRPTPAGFPRRVGLPKQRPL